MDKMLVVTFDGERQAYEGSRILKELHAEGSITVYAQAVVAKDAGGTVTIKEAADPGPLGTAVGLLTGSLVGLIGGPVGMAVGAAAGMAAGATYDIAGAGVGSDFLDEAAARLAPGKAAVVAEVEEEWILPLDMRMEAAGGTVIRRTRGEVVDAFVERDIAAMEADIAAMEAEYQQASGEARAKLQAKLDAARAKLNETREDAQARAEATQREAEAKLATLRAQADSASAERKQQLDQRAAEVQADYNERTAKLHEAQELRKEAGQLTREALTP
jgi:uncharacterized membrane protein